MLLQMRLKCVQHPSAINDDRVITDVFDTDDEALTTTSNLTINKYKFLDKHLYGMSMSPNNDVIPSRFSSAIEHAKFPLSIIKSKRAAFQQPINSNPGDASPPPLTRHEDPSLYVSLSYNSQVPVSQSPIETRTTPVFTENNIVANILPKECSATDLSKSNSNRQNTPIVFRRRSRLKPTMVSQGSRKPSIKSIKEGLKNTPGTTIVNWKFSNGTERSPLSSVSKPQSILCRIDSTKDVEELLRQNPDYQEYLRELHIQQSNLIQTTLTTKKAKLGMQLSFAMEE